ncbi:hypothetical protein [Jannaschia sp. R86511]|uniref:hypothetical protein n=1 Tax=Jannaschia sp. R86511 TaxID=3093853 RepID=UPI0036D31A5B
MPSTVRRLATALTAAGAALALSLASAPAALAADVEPPQNGSNSATGRSISMSWLEVGRLPGGVLGNYHQGYMTVETPGDGSGSYVFGDVVDLECPPGVTPDDGGGHGEEEPEGPFCEAVAFRTIDGGDLTVVHDKRNRSARLTGTLAVSDHGTPLGNPVVDIRLTGTATTFADRYSSRWSDGTVVYRSSYSQVGREATIVGRIGPMVFDNAEGEYSYATLSSWSEISRVRVRTP